MHADVLRIRILRFTLANHFILRLYRSRVLRVESLFYLSIAIYLPLSLIFPTLVFIIAPMLWGYIHLVSSYSEVTYLTTNQKHLRRTWLTAFALGMVGLAVFGLAHLKGWSIQQAEALIVVGTGALIIYWWRNEKRVLGRALAIAALSVALLLVFPLETAAVFMLAHNWIAFFYWSRACRDRSARLSLYRCLFLFALIHLTIGVGLFDGLLQLGQSMPRFDWDLINIGRMGQRILPWSINEDLWLRFFSLYVFGLAIHYFVWLKAIPECRQNSEFPRSISFRLRAFRETLGRTTVSMVGWWLVASSLTWIFLSNQNARTVYLLAAGFHGWFEILGLATRTERQG